MSPPRRAMAPIQRALDEQQEERREHHLPDAGMSYDSNATAPEDLSPGARASWYTNVTAAGAFSSSPRVPGAFTYSPVTVPASIADVAPAVPPAASTPPLPGANMFVVDLAAQQKAADMDNSGTTMMLDTSSCPASSTSIPNSLYELKAYERKSFCARWWWLLLLLTLLSLAGVGVGGYFLMPTVAQAFMDASQLRFQTIAITNATDGSFSATILGKISDAGPFSATTTPMRLTVYHQQQELGYMDMPAIELVTGEAALNTTTDFIITNLEAFTNFTVVMVQEKHFVWQIKGNTTLTTLGMSIPDLVMDKKVTLNGMNQLEGVRVKSFDVQEKRGGAVRTIIEAEFNNTSPISVQIGSVGFDMSYDDAFIGSAEAANVFVRSGPNVMQLTGELVPPTDVNATHYSQLFTNYLTGKESDVVCTGTGLIVTRRGNTTNVSWLDQAVKSMRMVATLPPSPKSLINDVSFEQLAMDFSANNTDPMVSAQQLLVDFELPFDIKVDVKEVRQSFEVYNSLGQAVGQSPMGTYAPASNTEDPQQIVAALSPSPLIVREDQYTVFSEFLRDIFKANSGQLSMTGTADVIAETALGPVELKGISFKQQTPVSGMQRLQYVKPDGRKSNPVLRGYRVLNGTKDGIVLETNILLHSASTLNVNLGDVTLDLLVNDTRIGYTMLKNLTVNSGDNAIDCMTYYAPRNAEERAAGDYMLSNSVNGLPTQMVMRGNANTSTTNRLLAATIGDLQLTAPLPGLEKPLVESATLRVNPFTVFNTDQGETSFEIDNYLDESFAFDALNMRISYKQSELATLDLSLRNTTDVEGPRNVTVPAHETLETEFYPVSMTDASSMQSLLAAAKGTVGALNVNATGTISAYIGQYHLVSAYNQVDLPTFVRVI